MLLMLPKLPFITKNLLPVLMVLGMAWPAFAADSYDVTSNQLTIPRVAVGNRLYRNVVITVDKILSAPGGFALTDYDSYNGTTNKLVIPSVTVGDKIYNNVTITVGKVLSYGDSLDLSVALLNVVPTDLDKIMYPDSYQTPAPAGTAELTDPCQLEIPQLTFPRQWLGNYPLPPIKGAPFASNISLSLFIKDIFLTDNPTTNGNCKGSLKAELDRTIARMKKLNTEVVYLPQWHWLAQNPDGSWYVVKAEDSNGPVNDSDFSYFVAAAHKAGLKVMMMNQIQGLLDAQGQPTQPESNSANYTKWFSAFTNYFKERGPYFQSLGIDYWELGCRVCIYADSGTGSTEDEKYFANEYAKLVTVMKSVYSGKVVFSGNSATFNRADVMDNVDVYIVGLFDNGYVPSTDSPFTADNYKQLLLKTSLTQYQVDLYEGTGKTLLFSESHQSRMNAFTNPGYLEETACVESMGDLATSSGGCLERETLPDFSMQAIWYEAAFEAIASVNWKTKVIVGIGDMWATDSLISTNVFPNLGATVRNKPAEGVIKAWFAQP